jgi:Ca2+ transporting ATPase
VSGSKVNEGTAVIIVCAVGRNSANGRLKMLMQNDEEEDTPLKKKLDEFGDML